MKLRPLPRPSSYCFLLVLVLVLVLPFLHLTPLSTTHYPLLASPRSSTPRLTVLTLLFDQTPGRDDSPNIEHNCLLIQPTPHRFIIYTDNITHPFCSVCTCIRFVKRNCPCLDRTENRCWGKDLCEKLYFVIDSLHKYREFLFLDADLMILKPSFLPHMAIRSRAHDFLATYGHASIDEPRKYYHNFNTGLFFMRYLPGLRYETMIDNMVRYSAGHDQGVISGFVQESYENWDVLSWKWHCRALGKRDIQIPPKECYTLHDRTEGNDVLKSLNMTRLRIGDGG